MWLDGTGLCHVRAALETLGQGLFRARLAALPERVQRRSAVRLKVRVPVRLKLTDGYVPTHTSDLSEGGLSVRLPDDAIVEVGLGWLISIMLDEKPVVLRGEIVRMRHHPNGGRVVGIRFCPSRHTETVRKWVFHRQINQRLSS